MLAAHTIPLVLFLLWGGVMADRFPRTLVLQVSDVASGLTQGAIALLVITGAAELWMVIVLSAADGLLSAMSFPALASLMPQLVQRDQLQRTADVPGAGRPHDHRPHHQCPPRRHGRARLGAVRRRAHLVRLGGVAARRPHPAATPPDDDAKAGTLAELRDGWTYFRRTTWLWAVVLAFGLLNAIQTGALFTLGPAVAKHTDRRAGLGSRRCRPSPSGWC